MTVAIMIKLAYTVDDSGNNDKTGIHCWGNAELLSTLHYSCIYYECMSVCGLVGWQNVFKALVFAWGCAENNITYTVWYWWDGWSRHYIVATERCLSGIQPCCQRQCLCCKDSSLLYTIVMLTRGQSNLTKSASRGAHSPVKGHPRGSKVVPLNFWGRVSY